MRLKQKFWSTARRVKPAMSVNGLAIAEAYALVYGHKASDDVIRRVRDLLGKETVEGLPDLRRIIMGLDRQSHPTPVIVRFDAVDIRYINIEGFRLGLDTADLAVSAPILGSRMYEPHLTGVFRRYLRPGWRVADVGANVGYYSMLAASIVGPSGEVLSFDPNSENARLILLNATENQFSNVHLFPLALSDNAGHVYFSSHIGSNGGWLAGKREQLTDGRGLVVPTARLDELVKLPVDFIKVDTEGAEYRVIRGSEGILESSHPIVSTEFSCEMLSRVSGVSPRDYLALFLDYGYSIYLVDRHSSRLESVWDIDEFLAYWGDPSRIEDLLMLPASAPILQPE